MSRPSYGNWTHLKTFYKRPLGHWANEGKTGNVFWIVTLSVFNKVAARFLIILLKEHNGRTPDYLQILYKRVIQSHPQLLATQLLNGWGECLPPNRYSHQYAFTTICLFLTSLSVGQPRLFQPYASCYPLTRSSAFQRKLRYLMGRPPIIRSQSVLLMQGNPYVKFSYFQRTFLKNTTH